MPFKNVLKTEGVCVVEQLMLENFLRTENSHRGGFLGVSFHIRRGSGEWGGVGLCIYRALSLKNFEFLSLERFFLSSFGFLLAVQGCKKCCKNLWQGNEFFLL